MKKMCRKMFFVLFGVFAIFAMSCEGLLVSLSEFGSTESLQNSAQNCEVCADEVDEEKVSAYEESSNSKEISDSTSFQSYVKEWSGFSVGAASSDTVKLTSDINMSGVSVSGTIGTSANPFVGTFDGDGHTISNLTIEISSSTSGYAGLFGYASGATIKNVTFSNLTIVVSDSATTLNVGLIGYASSCMISEISITGTYSLTWSSGTISYVGGLVGRADNSTIKNVQNISSSSKMTLSSDFTGNTQIGLLVGRAENSTLTQAIVRREVSEIEFSTTSSDSKTYFGEVVGGLTGGSNFTFVAVEVDSTFSTTSDFLGSVYIGGTVGLISGGSTMLQNIAMSNSYAITDEADACVVGEVCGIVSSPIPTAGNISYIHYASTGHDRIASGSYSFSNTATMDYVTAAASSLRTLAYVTDESGNVSYTYFTGQTWAPLLGDWNFDSIFYATSANVLALQCFYTNFIITTRSTTVLTVPSSSSEFSGAIYGESVELTFMFVEGMEDYYVPSTLYLGSTGVATIYTTESSGSVSYSISSPDLYSISKISGGFVITIEFVDMSSVGEYYVSCTANSFNMTVVSCAYSITNNGTSYTISDIYSDSSKISNLNVDTSDVPGYVFYSTSSVTTTEKLTRTITIESSVPIIQTSVISGKAYVFSGYWLVVYDDSGEDETCKLVKSNNFSFSLNTYDVAENFTVYALYSDSACQITFTVGDGVQAIYVAGDEVTEADDWTVIVPQSSTTVKIEIMVSNDYEFDADLFTDLTGTFKGSMSFSGEEEHDDYSTYVFYFDMTSLADATYSSLLSLQVKTTEIQKGLPSWAIWAIIGGVCGVLVIGIVIFIIVYVVKNKNGFGGSSSFKRSKRGGIYY